MSSLPTSDAKVNSGTEAPADTGRQYLYGVQGLRTVAALMVAVYHIWFNKVSGGVDVFFVVAGYFAAGSIVRILSAPEWPKRLAALWQYWMRTARRVVPSAAVVILGTTVLAWFFLPQSEWNTTIRHGMMSLVHLENWYLISEGNDYLAQGLRASPYQQFWALSIQVQSYVLFPLIVLAAVFVARRSSASVKKVAFTTFATVFTLSLLYSVWFTRVDQPSAYFHLAPRMWEFAAGGVLALGFSKAVGHPKVMRVLGWAGLISIVLFAAIFDPSRKLPGYIALVPVLSGAAVILASRAGVEPRILKSKPMLWFADSSFAFYLWHWPLLVLYKWHIGKQVSLKGGLAILVLSAALAVATTILVEQPIRQSRLLQKSTLATVTVSMLLASLTLGVLFGWFFTERSMRAAAWEELSQIRAGKPVPEGELAPASIIARRDISKAYKKGCVVGRKSPKVKACTWGDKESDITVALVGGSHDTQWVDSIAASGKRNGFKLITHIKSACAFGKMEEADYKIYNTCQDWNNAVTAELIADPPDLVVTMATRKTKGGDDMPEWKVNRLKELTGEGIKVLGIRDNPWLKTDVPGCVGIQDPESCGHSSKKVLTPLEDLVIEEFPLFTFLETSEDYCPDGFCDVVRDGVVMYRDSHHLTITWTLLHGDRVNNAILDALGLEAQPED